MWLMHFWCTVPHIVCSSPYLYYPKFSLHQIQVRYQSIRPPSTMGQGGLLLCVGVGAWEVRYRTYFFSQKIAQVLVNWSQRAHSLKITRRKTGVLSADQWTILISMFYITKNGFKTIILFIIGNLKPKLPSFLKFFVNCKLWIFGPLIRR